MCIILNSYDNLWYICFQGGYPNEMEDEYSYEQVLEFHYMYYDFAIFRLEKLEEEEHSNGQIRKRNG